jgi:hypothetical protein
MPESINNWPATLGELADLAEKQGKRLSDLVTELERDLGPCPMPPKGYTLAKGSSGYWTGPEIFARAYIITPGWNSATNTHHVELWLSKDHQPMTPIEAMRLGLDLAKAANALGVGE